MELNPLAIAVGVVLVCGGAMYAMSDSDQVKNVTVQPDAPALPTSQKSADQATTNEDVKTLIATFKVQEAETAELKKKLRDVTDELQRSKLQDESEKQQIINNVVDKINTTGALNVSTAVQDKLTDLENQVRQFTGHEQVPYKSADGSSIDDYGVDHSASENLGNRFDDGSGTYTPSKAIQSNKQLSLGDSVQYKGWTLPDDAQLAKKQGGNGEEMVVDYSLTKDHVFKQNTGSTLHHSLTKQEVKEKKIVDHVTKFGTIPQESTLMGSVTMTALLGRIPVKGKLVDPFEFKVLIGNDNLATNGIYIPHLKSMVLTGVAKGNYTGQCVSGDIISGTYTFDDGRIQSFNANDMADSQSQSEFDAAGSVTDSRVGWISTPTGIPCLSGKYISDAPSFIALQGGLAALGGLANGYAQSAKEISGTGDQQNAVIVNPDKYAAGTAADAAAKSATAWINDIRSSAFAMVYLPPNQKIAIHIDKSIPIDYHSTARKVSYSNDWSSSNAKTNNLD
ncbi:TIGR03752 family integrating conjugative element protein [Photobacterium leiognathi]|uniref:TIGR03752 family integrating conjugative element protein n=1 Tax=Photobacterium leiognathi TaxID=553611 RepID=UPI002980D8F6|nr:TIGR03752 family integrating conjugative element protein [Photobacterium leiognathi]